MPRISKITVLKFVATATLLFFLYRRVDVAKLKDAVSDLRAFPLVMFFPICAANMALSALRWRTLLRADGINLPLGKLFTSYWIASFFNCFMPSNIGGDVYRIADIAKRSAKPVNTTVSVFADRLIGFIAMSFLGVVFPLAGLRFIPSESRWVLMMAAFVFACFIAAAFIVRTEFFIGLIPKLLPRKWRDKTRAAAETVRGSFAAYGRDPAVIFKCLGISLVFQMMMVAAIWCVGYSLGLRIPFFVYCVFVPIINLLESIPFTIYGIGFRDYGYMMFLTAAGAAAADTYTMNMSVIYVTLTLVYSSLGGLIFLARTRR